MDKLPPLQNTFADINASVMSEASEKNRLEIISQLRYDYIAEIKSTIKNAVAQGNKRAGFNENPDFPEVLIELSAAGYHVQKCPLADASLNGTILKTLKQTLI